MVNYCRSLLVKSRVPAILPGVGSASNSFLSESRNGTVHGDQRIHPGPPMRLSNLEGQNVCLDHRVCIVIETCFDLIYRGPLGLMNIRINETWWGHNHESFKALLLSALG